MALDFTENLTIELPDVRKAIQHFSEADSTTGGHKIIVEVAAIHHGLTSNYNFYKADALEKSLESWTHPYPKPILLNHDTEVNPIGRVMAARMDQEADGTPFVCLRIAITDPQAVERVMDQRYMTGSVGGKAKEARCSICQTDWAEASMFQPAPCKHQRGKVYNGKLAYFEMNDVSFREYSFVNVPADQRSMILAHGVSESENEEGWTHAVAEVYALDMNKESVLKFSESADPVNVLTGMRKKDAHLQYTNLKGTWITASAYNATAEDDENDINTENVIYPSDNTTIDTEASSNALTNENAEENNMPKPIEGEEELDITSVLESLSDDLNATSQSDEGEADEATSEENSEEAPEASEESESEEAQEDEASEGSEDEAAEEAAETEESEEGESTADTDEPASESDSTTEQLTEQTETTADELAEGENDDESQALIEQLTSENKKLKAMLHKMLAERVVEKKIDLGFVLEEDRAASVSEHAERSASSLADTLRDLHKLPKASHSAPANSAVSVELNGSPLATGSEPVESETQESKPAVKKEDAVVELLTGALMGRRTL